MNRDMVSTLPSYLRVMTFDMTTTMTGGITKNIPKLSKKNLPIIYYSQIK